MSVEARIVTIEVPGWIVDQILRDRFTAFTAVAQLVGGAIRDSVSAETETEGGRETGDCTPEK